MWNSAAASNRIGRHIVRSVRSSANRNQWIAIIFNDGFFGRRMVIHLVYPQVHSHFFVNTHAIADALHALFVFNCAGELFIRTATIAYTTLDWSESQFFGVVFTQKVEDAENGFGIGAW